MKLNFNEYYIIFCFLTFAFCFSMMMFFLSFFFIPKRYDQEKVSAYECGFNPFENARATFDMRFYTVAILFLIFDTEMSYLFPWVFSLSTENTMFNFWVMVVFTTILTIGFVYEWYKGALEWE
uniref:NADH dehydrogenase subunit 3 n=1 Tax=Bostrychia tenuissima TaxID=196631 RepID=UPI002E772B62|nr:NADH dehydrogenase subunit 3 [Bostrychia tenuissima]WQF69442.1 NADH dehydrogenase subunit 3 [Bostrychia tenuissima]